MSTLTTDEHPALHYLGTGAHCWVAPVDVDQRRWDETVRQHLLAHLLSGDRAWHHAVHLELAPREQEFAPGRHRQIRTVDELGVALAEQRAYETNPSRSGLGSGDTPPHSGGTLPAGPAAPPGDHLHDAQTGDPR
jgi:hypothetical protein